MKIATPWLRQFSTGVDARSKPQIDELLSEYGPDRARQLFGHDPCSSDIAPKVLWFKENMPEVHERAAKFLTASSYLCAKLTGRFKIDRYLAEDFLPLYDRETWQVNERGARGSAVPTRWPKSWRRPISPA